MCVHICVGVGVRMHVCACVCWCAVDQCILLNVYDLRLCTRLSPYLISFSTNTSTDLSHTYWLGLMHTLLHTHTHPCTYTHKCTTNTQILQEQGGEAAEAFRQTRDFDTYSASAHSVGVQHGTPAVSQASRKSHISNGQHANTTRSSSILVSSNSVAILGCRDLSCS